MYQSTPPFDLNQRYWHNGHWWTVIGDFWYWLDDHDVWICYGRITE
jgi:hypothetical protein